MAKLLDAFRTLRILLKQVLGIEPIVRVKGSLPLRYHGNINYGGWNIPDRIIDEGSVVVDVGLGEDISFSQSLIRTHGCKVHGFDPTPKAIDFVENADQDGFILHKLGLAGTTRKERFFLPSNDAHVSGSITQSEHLGGHEIPVELVSFSDLLGVIESDSITLLKMDIEGAEYEVIDSVDFQALAKNVQILCIEFHHRWKQFGPEATRRAVRKLELLGFHCVWRATTSNEEFTFVRAL